jgi:hypothetical protein
VLSKVIELLVSPINLNPIRIRTMPTIIVFLALGFSLKMDRQLETRGSGWNGTNSQHPPDRHYLCFFTLVFKQVLDLTYP